jgi:hypothetical protein
LKKTDLCLDAVYKTLRKTLPCTSTKMYPWITVMDGRVPRNIKALWLSSLYTQAGSSANCCYRMLPLTGSTTVWLGLIALLHFLQCCIQISFSDKLCKIYE